MNLLLLDTETLQKIIAHCAQKFGLSVAEVERDVVAQGMPILAEDCTAVLNDLQRWL